VTQLSDVIVTAAGGGVSLSPDLRFRTTPADLQSYAVRDI
jgi:hypothetical protein